MRPVFRATKRILAVSAVAALLVTACGDDDDDGDSGAADASSAPIKILNWTTVGHANYSAPDTKAGAQAKVDAINAAGGIKGRQLQLEFCNVNFDPNGEAACARQAVDGGFAAVVGATSFFPNTFPLLERAGVPAIGGIGLIPQEMRSEISYPLGSGTPGWTQGSAAFLVQRGAKRVAIVTSPIAAAQYGAENMKLGLQRAGLEPVRSVDAPVGAPDQSTVAAQAAEGTDAVLIAAVAGDAIKVIQSLRQSGYAGLIATVSAQFPQDVLNTLGDDANGMLLTSQTVPVTQEDNPAIAEFIKDMDALDPAEKKSERAQISWGAVALFAGVVERMDGEVTASSVRAAMDDLSEPVDVGLVAPYRTDGEAPSPELPRLFNPTIIFTEVRDGRLVQVSDGFVNPFELLTEAAGG